MEPRWGHGVIRLKGLHTSNGRCMRRFVTIGLVILHVGWNIGCSSIRQSTTKNRSNIHEIVMDPLHIGLAPDTELGLVDYDASTLFQEALRFHEAQQCPVAQKYYVRLLQ